MTASMYQNLNTSSENASPQFILCSWKRKRWSHVSLLLLSWKRVINVDTISLDCTLLHDVQYSLTLLHYYFTHWHYLIKPLIEPHCELINCSTHHSPPFLKHHILQYYSQIMQRCRYRCRYLAWNAFNIYFISLLDLSVIVCWKFTALWKLPNANNKVNT